MSRQVMEMLDVKVRRRRLIVEGGDGCKDGWGGSEDNGGDGWRCVCGDGQREG